MTVRTRFAPSPTGYMHVGNLRTALYAFLTAKHEDGTFILRIEDTDQERFTEGATEVIYGTLKETGLNWDEGPDVGGDFGPYIQSERMGTYLQYAEQLVESGNAYYCFCSEERLKALYDEQVANGEAVGHYDRKCCGLSKEEVQARLDAGEPYVIRQKMPREGTTCYDDIVYGHLEFDNAELEDQILIKSDGMPTYNFANVIDDHLMGITHVVRGMEYLSSTPKYNLLYKAFGWATPQYIHCPPVMKDKHNKLSKRNGDASYQDLAEKGYLPEAILNYLLLLGWGSSDDREFFTLPEMVEAWDPARISKSPAIFDPEKLLFINATYINNMTDEEFLEASTPWIRSVVKSEIDIELLSRNLKPRCEILSDIPDRVRFIDDMPEFDAELYKNKKFKTTTATSLEALNLLIPALTALDTWTKDSISEVCIGMAKEHEVKNGWMLYPLGIALSGMKSTPGGGTDLATIMGRDKTLERMQAAIEHLQAVELPE